MKALWSGDIHLGRIVCNLLAEKGEGLPTFLGTFRSEVTLLLVVVPIELGLVPHRIVVCTLL